MASVPVPTELYEFPFHPTMSMLNFALQSGDLREAHTAVQQLTRGLCLAYALDSSDAHLSGEYDGLNTR